MKPSELYARTPRRIDKTLYHLIDHLPELNDLYHTESQNELIETHFYEDHCFDGERVWQLAGVFYKGLPVMIIQNAGRGGRDHSDRFITDRARFLEMLAYIRHIIGSDVIFVHPVDTDIATLDSFYSHTLEDFR